MGIYFNPKNRSFSKDRNYEIYVDKTGLLSFLNKAIDTPQNCLQIPRLRLTLIMKNTETSIMLFI